MGDRKRFAAMAGLAAEILPLEARVVDVAGGEGRLQAEMRRLGFRDVTSWDKRRRYKKGRVGYRYGWFSWACEEKYDAVVAMHPDEGTDHAILYAVRNGVPALVCPCCVLPSAEAYYGSKEFSSWLEHLRGLCSGRSRLVELGMTGRNMVLVITT